MNKSINQSKVSSWSKAVSLWLCAVWEVVFVRLIPVAWRREVRPVVPEWANLSFVVEEIKAEKWLKMEGEERRTEGNLVRWPLSKTGLLANTSRYGPHIQKDKGGTDLITEDKWGKPM
jgi:hypothetical protein